MQLLWLYLRQTVRYEETYQKCSQSQSYGVEIWNPAFWNIVIIILLDDFCIIRNWQVARCNQWDVIVDTVFTDYDEPLWLVPHLGLLLKPVFYWRLIVDCDYHYMFLFSWQVLTHCTIFMFLTVSVLYFDHKSKNLQTRMWFW